MQVLRRHWDGDGELGVAAALAPLTAEITRTGTYAEEIDAAMSGTMEARYKGNGSEVYEYTSWAIGRLVEELESNAPEGTYFSSLIALPFIGTGNAVDLALSESTLILRAHYMGAL